MKPLSRNVLSLLVGDVGSRVLGFIATTYLARTLQPDGFGLVNVALAVLGYLMLVMSPGVHIYATRVVAQRDKDLSFFVGEVLSLRLLLALAGILLTGALTLGVLGPTSASILIIAYSLSLIPMALSVDWFFQGTERMEGIGWSRIVLNVVYLVVLLLFVTSPTDIVFAAVAYVLGNSAVAIGLYSQLRKKHPELASGVRLTFNHRSQWKDILRQSIPIGLGTILAQVAYNFPPILLGIVSSAAEVGYYGAALRVVFFLMIFDRLITTLFLPVVARFHKERPEELAKVAALIMKVTLLFALPIAVGGTILAHPIMMLIYESAFADAVPVFQLLIWFFFFSAASSIYAVSLLGRGDERRYAVAMAVGTLVQIALVTTLGILEESVGAAAGYAFGELVLFFVLILFCRHFLKLSLLGAAWRPIIATGLMAAAVFLLSGYGLLITVPAGALVFLVSVFVIGGLTRTDLVSLKDRLL